MQCIWVSSFSVIAKGELDLASMGRLLQRGWLRCSLRFLPKRIFLRTGNLLCQKGLLWTLPSSGTLEDVVILLTELVSAAPHLYQPGPGLSQRAPDQQDSQLEWVSQWVSESCSTQVWVSWGRLWSGGLLDKWARDLSESASLSRPSGAS